MKKIVIVCALLVVSCGKDDKPSVGVTNSKNNVDDMSTMTTSDMSTTTPDSGRDMPVDAGQDLAQADVGVDGGADGGVDSGADMSVAPCGNGMLDPGENCDPGIAMGPGACPTTCDDGIVCTQDAMTGTAADCSATCTTMPICRDGDGCCAMGCTIANDSECFVPSGMSLGATSYPGPLNISASRFAAGPNGTFFLGGLFQGDLALGTTTLTPVNSYTAAWVAEFDAAGNVVWAKKLDSDNADALVGLAYDGVSDTLKVAVAPRGASLDLDGMVVPLNGDLDIVVASLDAANNGNPLWAHAYGDTLFQIAYGLTLAPDGSVWLAGGFQGTVDFGGGAQTAQGFDAILLHLTAAGGYLNEWHWGGTGDDVVRAVSVFGDGSVVATGTFQATVNFGGMDKNSLNVTDLYVVRLDAAGNHVWSVAHGGPGYQASSDVAALPNGDVAVVGGFQSSVDFGPGHMLMSNGDYDAFVAVLDGANGMVKRAVRAGGPGGDQAVSVVPSFAGLNVVGYFSPGATDFFGNALTLYGGEDIYVARLTPMAATSWIQTFGGAADDRGLDVGVDPGYAVHAVGFFDGMVDFGSGTVPAGTGHDGFHAVFAP